MFVNHDVVSCSISNGPGVNKTCSFKNGTKNEDILYSGRKMVTNNKGRVFVTLLLFSKND